MDLKELVHQANQLVHQEGHTLQELLQKNDFPGNAAAIIQLIKDNSVLIDEPSEQDYLGLLKALEKRREISLKATYAAVLHLLLPEKFPLKSLDNFKSNLQLEKNIAKEPSMAESEELSQEDIEALLAGNLSDKKDKKSAKVDDQLSNDDIDALLAGVGSAAKPSKSDDISEDDLDALLAEVAPTPKKPSTGSVKIKKEESFSAEDIEALLAGEPTKSNAEPKSENIAQKSNPVHHEDSVQISEDDIQALLDAQNSQDLKNPLVKALGIEEEKLNTPNKRTGNTDKLEPKIQTPEPEPEPQAEDESVSEKTKIPADVFPSQKNLEELLSENEFEAEMSHKDEDDYDFSSLNVGTPPIKFNTPSFETSSKATPKETTTRAQPYNQEKMADLMNSSDVKERILSDVYALYVNKNGKPVLHAECKDREEAKRAYLQAMQNYPQNSLFIEKISRKEIIVIKESKEIINLKINISFE